MNINHTARMLLATALMLTACEAEQEYSTWPCRFAYKNDIHVDATLASVMDYNSRGIFCLISESVFAGKKYLNFKNNLGDESQQPESAEEEEAKYILGLNNGIIVGFQTLNTEPNGGFVGYDAQCPNCVRRENNMLSPTYYVDVAFSGIGTCRKCHKRYDLNNNGIVLDGEKDDMGLQKYAASTTAPYGYISVGTKRY